MTLQEKIDNNIVLNNDELKQLNKMIYEQEKKRIEEHNAYLASLPKVEPEKTQEQKWIDGDEPLPNTLKIVDGTIIRKSQREMYKDKVITKEEYASYQRVMRDGKLIATDKYLLSDYPINESDLKRVKEYRQMLRDLPTQKNFPDVDIPDFSL